MKKSLYFIPALIALVFSSCEKEIESQDPVEGTKTVTFNIIDNDLGADTKTAVTTTGVQITGTETVALFYYDETNSKFVGSESATTQPTQASPVSSGTNTFSFTSPVDSPENYTWYPIMPFNYNIVRLNSAGSASYVRLSPVQFPGENTFDPSMDYLVGCPFTVDTDGNGTVTGYKRLFTPLRLDLTGLNSGEKVHAVTLSFAQTATNSSFSTLTGTFYVNLSATFDEVDFNSVESKSVSNAISAVSLDGLSASDSTWPVWFMVNAMSLIGDATITVTTESRTIERTFTIPSTVNITASKINTLGVNMAADGVSTSESITQCFTTNNSAHKFVNGTASLTDCAGNTYSWTATQGSASLAWSNSGCATTAARLNGSSFTIPSISGKNVVAVRIYGHCNSPASGTGTATLELLDGETQKDIQSANLMTTTTYATSLASTGGVTTFTLPDGYTTMSGLTVSGTGAVLVSAITLIVEDAQ